MEQHYQQAGNNDEHQQEMVNMDYTNSFTYNNTNQNFANDNANFSSQYSQMQYQQEEHKINNVKDIFVREDEQEKAVIGGGYLKDLLHTGVLN